MHAMITYRLLAPEELRPALRLVLDHGQTPPALLEEQVSVFLGYVRTCNLGVDRQWGAFDAGRMIAASLIVVSPGRSAILYLPRSRPRDRDEGVMVELLRRVVADAPAVGVKFIQAMVTPDAEHEISILSESGFRFLAELIYMERNANALFPKRAAADTLQWIPYNDARHALFASTIMATYEDSLDCPGLNGLRTIDDILASHRAVGEFDERRWFVVACEGTPIGALLLAHVPARDALEVVYMGLSPQWRGRGIGSAVIHHAVKVARDAGCSIVSLAADASNTPAVRLYRGCGFIETTRRGAWIATPGAVTPFRP